MSRGLTTAIKTALAAGTVEFYHLVELDFATPLRYTTAPYDVSYGGNTYTSSHVITSIPKIKETLGIKPNNTQFCFLLSIVIVTQAPPAYM